MNTSDPKKLAPNKTDSDNTDAEDLESIRVDPNMLVPVAEQAELDASKVQAHLAVAGLRFDPHRVRQFRGGLANINFLVYVDDKACVLRRPPSGKLPPGAHDMVREHRILSRLGEAYRFAPRSVHLCEDLDVLGVPFQLIEYRPGVVVRGDDLGSVAQHPGVEQKLSNIIVETMVALHRVDPASVGLDELGRPEGFLARGVAGWVKRGALIEGSSEVAARVDEIGRWLSSRIDSVAPRNATLLHCDFKLDNLILDPATLDPVAVIDWDMGTRGDPLFDLATLLSYWTEPNDPPVMHQLAQMPTGRGGFASRADVVERYVNETGCEIGGFDVVRVLCVFKLAVVFLQLHQRWRSGGLAGSEYQTFDQLGSDLLEFALDVAHGRYT